MASTEVLSEIVLAFRSEAQELVQGISEALLRHEQVTEVEERRQAISLAFRHAHNIKGAASSLGLLRAEKLVHALEDVLTAVRDGEVELSAKIMDGIFSALDVVEDVVNTTRPGEEELDERDRQTVELLNELLAKGPGSTSQRPDATAASRSAAGVAVEQKEARGEKAAQSPKESQGASFVRVSQQKLDTLLAQLGELVEMKIRMEEVHRRVQEVEEDLGRLERPDLKLPRKPLKQLARGVEQDIQYLTKLLSEIRGELLELRMVPISTIFPVLRRAVRDVCRKRDLEVELKLEGGKHELDRKIVEDVKSPLVHLLRNAVDHGMEPPGEREEQGKPAVGRIELKVLHRGGSILLEVADDGRGVDFNDIYTRAVELGWYERSEDEPAQAELQRLLFSSGMSTARTADTISGRGVGLSVVRKAVESLRGTISIDTEKGRGTTFRIALPLTLAADTGLFVSVGGARFVIPRTAVQRAVAFRAEDVSLTNNVANLWYSAADSRQSEKKQRESGVKQHIPLARLEPSLRLSRFMPRENGDSHLAIILSSAEAMAAIVVDEIEDEAEIVVRDLGSFIQRLENVSGLTVTASGEMYFVLNPSDLVRAVVRPLGPSAISADETQDIRDLGSSEWRDTVILVVDDSVTSRILNQNLLTASGFRVLTASDGFQALEILKTQRCDLVLTDVEMPQMNGFELTRRIKQDQQLSQLPVILLTALERQEDKERGIEVGADAYLIKRELSQTALLTTIDQLI